MLFAAKCYWPGVTESELRSVAARETPAADRHADNDAEYLGSLLFTVDDLVLCLFEGSSRAGVIRATQRLGIPCERLMESVWLARDGASRPGLAR